MTKTPKASRALNFAYDSGDRCLSMENYFNNKNKLSGNI